MFLLAYALSFLPHMLAMVVVHEAGHLVFGLFTGYRFSSFNVLGLVWARDETGKIVKRRNKNKLIMGQCLMEPPGDYARFRYGLYNAGGGLANLLFFAVFACGYTFFGNRALSGFCLSGAVVHLYIALVNLIPINTPLPNDGMNIFMASRSPLAKKGFYTMLSVNMQLQAGRRFAQFTKEELEADSPPNQRNYFELYYIILSATRLIDQGRWDEAMALYQGLDFQQINKYYAATIKADMLYDALIYHKDAARAQALHKDKVLAKLLKSGWAGMGMVQVAWLFFAEGKQEQARALLEKEREKMKTQPNRGMALMVLDEMKLLEEEMDRGVE